MSFIHLKCLIVERYLVGTTSSVVSGTVSTVVGRRHLSNSDTSCSNRHICVHRAKMNDPNHMLQSIWMAPGELDQHLEVGDLVEISRPAASSSVTYSVGSCC